MTRIALIADVHGNLPALRAVVADLATRGVDGIVNLGDHASGPLWPRETVEFLMQQPWTQIAGNHDHQLVNDDPSTHGPSDRYAFSQLRSEQMRWLAALPATAVVAHDVLLCHGTPMSDRVYFLETVAHGRLRLANPGEITERLGRVHTSVVACGHSHVPGVVMTESGVMIVNPGSVGLQAYDDTVPEPYVSETGSPYARYAILERRDEESWRVTSFVVRYDHAAAARRAAENGQRNWSVALETGFAAR